MPTDWISTTEAAELSGYNPEYIRRLIRAGKIKVTQKGMRFWVDRDSFLEYVRQSRTASKKDKRHGPKRKTQD